MTDWPLIQDLLSNTKTHFKRLSQSFSTKQGDTMPMKRCRICCYGCVSSWCIPSNPRMVPSCKEKV